MGSASFKPFWPLALVQQALAALVFVVRGLCGHFRFCALGLTRRSSRPAYCGRLILFVRFQVHSVNTSTVFLAIAAAACAVAALLHFACIPWGAEGYRFLGAGENVANAVAAGDWRPHVSAAMVGTLLLVWGWYALAGAGLAPTPPLLRLGLFTIAAVLILRALAFPLLRSVFPGNSELFWFVSSGLVGILGVLFLVGTLLAHSA